MRKSWAAVVGSLLGSFMAVGCAAPLEEPETAGAPIIAGTADPGDPAMVEVFAIRGNSVAKCTATLVSPRVLLTAAHCVQPGGRFGVYLGNDDRKITGKDLLPTSAAAYDPMWNRDPSNGHDVAVVVLATPLTIPPVPINRAPLPASAVGKMARYVGYGLTNGVAMTGDGIKRHAMAPIAQITRLLVRMGMGPNGTCHGDSGGPLLMDNGAGEAVIGVVSFGDDAGCRRNSYFQRIDTQVAWVDEQIKKYDPGVMIPDGGVGGGVDAGTPDVAIPDVGPPDTSKPDLAVAVPPDAAAPAVKKDASAPKPTTKPDARPPTEEEEGEDTNYSQAVAGSACAVAPARAEDAGAAKKCLLAGLLLAAALLARRRRR